MARVDMPLVADSGSAVAIDAGRPFTGVAVREAGQWASLCPELDIASVGRSADEAIDRLVQAVAEALQFAAEEGLEAGRPTPPDDLRVFIVSGDAPFYVRKFYV
jgi:predicted RNase H-like HicB family nuclease